MLGLSMAPATGKLVAEVLTAKRRTLTRRLMRSGSLKPMNPTEKCRGKGFRVHNLAWPVGGSANCETTLTTVPCSGSANCVTALPVSGPTRRSIRLGRRRHRKRRKEGHFAFRILKIWKLAISAHFGDNSVT